MIKLPRYTSNDLPIMLGTIVPFTVLLNWVIFGSAYFTDWRTLLPASLISGIVLIFSFIGYGHIALAFRNRFKDDTQFLKRVVLQILLFLLMTALILVGLFSLYSLLGMADGSYENNFIWAFVLTGILNVFLSFLNEAIWRFEQWKEDLKETEQLKITYKQGQLMGLKSQINPHVLFNSLNSLSGLIQEDTEQAEKFLDEMSKVYRYMLRNEEEQLVTLATELQFIRSYYALLKARYNEALDLQMQVNEEDMNRMLPPLSLQVIIENALFQHVASRDCPLRIRIQSVKGEAVVVSNNVQRKIASELIDYEAGLDNLVKKYQLMNQLPVEIREGEEERKIRLPLITQTEEAAL
ncbi:MAG: histidine kinase [Sphingobacteriales bacterium]|nr:histidine kinase [Sphingobacteriales bacterium]NCT73919.1 hypothetical protein [Chitinophagaceae bacterium]OJW35580.1 MAG: hypothetical protein BGO54_04530 [Sphingobacteriales bacterium 46-32]